MRFLALALLLLLSGCAQSPAEPASPADDSPEGDTEPQALSPAVSRHSMIPSGAVKEDPSSDLYPPVLHADGFEAPVPLGPPVNTAGAEDSPFITPGGNTLYFFFTPDVRVPPEKQLLDNVTGIWVSKKGAAGWTEPERVILQDKGKLALDGCEFVQGERIWFCSAREGYSGINWFTARQAGGTWQDWTDADFPAPYAVGELHITADGRDLYFHSARAGGKGGLDIWTSRNEGGQWQEPVNAGAVNSPDDEGWPFISRDGRELWFSRTLNGTPAVFRSKLQEGAWAEPELVVSTFAGEPTMDGEGNLYFVHHYFRDGKMLEADIYVAYANPLSSS